MAGEWDADVVVVGCGAAGLSAAVAARQAGAEVLVLERAPKEERGGNTRHTGAWLRMQDAQTVSDDFLDHFAANPGALIDPDLVHQSAGASEGWPSILRAMSMVDPEVVATLADKAPETLDWLTGLGLRFERLEVPFLSSVQPRMAPSGGGLAIVETLAEAFEAAGGRIRYGTAAQALVQDESGAVAGLRAIGPGNRRETIRAGAVILASGGFQGNAEMMVRYLGPRARHLGMLSRGCHYNKGEGIRMALDIGAAPCGDFGSWHASPMDPRSRHPGPSLYIYPYGILVNRLGRRFTDEGSGPTDETYEAVSRIIHAQPRGIAYAIVDAGADDIPHPRAAVRSEVPPVEAGSVAELARAMDLPEATLTETVETYNAACRPGRFAPQELDGLATEGLEIGKSNWARPIERPPFRAWPVVSSVVFTFGGLRVNAGAQVVNLQGDAIPGLYAAGETMGLYYGSYTGATSVLKALVFGCLAGAAAARMPVSA